MLGVGNAVLGYQVGSGAVRHRVDEQGQVVGTEYESLQEVKDTADGYARSIGYPSFEAAFLECGDGGRLAGSRTEVRLKLFAHLLHWRDLTAEDVESALRAD